MDESSVGLFATLVFWGILILTVAGMWTVFSKAGQPGWACLVPLYNMVVLLQVAGRPTWWLVLMFLPFVNMVIFLIVMIDVAKAFGKGAGFGLGLFFLGPVFYPMLGFGDAEYSSAH